MEFINEYNKIMSQLRNKVRDLEAENEADGNRKEELNEEYQAAVTDLDFDKANDLKRQMKEIEINQETREDMVQTLNKKIIVGDADAAKKAAVKFNEAKKEHIKQRDKLEAEAIKKRNEYVSALMDVHRYNLFLDNGVEQFKDIYKVISRLNNAETVEEIGFNPMVLTQKQKEEINIHDFLIGNLYQLIDLSEREGI